MADARARFFRSIVRLQPLMHNYMTQGTPEAGDVRARQAYARID
jgi:hypothetical protein